MCTLHITISATTVTFVNTTDEGSVGKGCSSIEKKIFKYKIEIKKTTPKIYFYYFLEISLLFFVFIWIENPIKKHIFYINFFDMPGFT